MKKRITKSIDQLLRYYDRYVTGNKHFIEYIEEVSNAWWDHKHEDTCNPSLSVCIDTIHDENDNDESWQCCHYWQRKLTNKLNARNFAIKNEIPVPDLYWYGKNASDIPFDNLPDNYVIKTSFGSGSTHVIPVMKGVNVFNNIAYRPARIIEFFKQHMSRVAPYGYIMVEELLTKDKGTTLAKDYKCDIFNGKIAFINVIDRINKERVWYTREWDPPEKKVGSERFKDGIPEEKPKYYNDLIYYAEKLGKAYGPTYVRIDFYITGRGCVFGEFTPFPSGGKGYSRYGDITFGKLWRDM